MKICTSHSFKICPLSLGIKCLIAGIVRSKPDFDSRSICYAVQGIFISNERDCELSWSTLSGKGHKISSKWMAKSNGFQCIHECGHVRGFRTETGYEVAFLMNESHFTSLYGYRIDFQKIWTREQIDINVYDAL